jgi:hypothetical protein
MELPQHVRYWLTRQHKMLAAEVPPTLPGHRAWVGVYPPGDFEDTYVIRYFEVESSLVAHDYDIHEEQLANTETIEVADESELTQVLSRWIHDFDTLKGPSFSDYPI